MSKDPLNAVQKQALDEALKMAIAAQDLDMMTNAVDSGADADMMLFSAVAARRLDWVKAAIDHGADIHASRSGISDGNVLRSNVAYPVFFWLTENFSAEVGDFLLAKGAKIDAPSPSGDTALMAAVRLQQEKVIKYLVDHDADPLRVCADQKVPLKVIEDADWYNSDKKLALVKAMMANTKRRSDAAAVAAPANDSGPAPATSEAIEINRPIELKRKPASGFTL